MPVTKPYQSPNQVTYDDLVKHAEDHLRWMIANFPGMVASGRMSSWSAQHSIEVGRKTLSLMKRFKKNPQGDLFREFEKLKN